MKMTYHKQGDYLYPDLLPPEKEDRFLGKYRRLRLKYLKEHRPIVYANLLTSGELDKHLHKIDKEASEQVELLIRQMAEKQGVTEELKAKNQLEWVGRMNNIKACAEEIVFKEMIYG